ncbi:hypothetical protein EMPS_00049 [Entomortierella parvispora]|uniref:Arb2-like domain-containing protein n=1 Tax=Entomortierella parvispora TaxID=205924 RepID=A0A9P3LQS2_9FUNG|nr:hypothetical protein EMPS_00049 [Entomortierella parvispora]
MSPYNLRKSTLDRRDARSNGAGVERGVESPPRRPSRQVPKKRAKETLAPVDASRQASCHVDVSATADGLLQVDGRAPVEDMFKEDGSASDAARDGSAQSGVVSNSAAFRRKRVSEDDVAFAHRASKKRRQEEVAAPKKPVFVIRFPRSLLPPVPEGTTATEQESCRVDASATADCLSGEDRSASDAACDSPASRGKRPLEEDVGGSHHAYKRSRSEREVVVPRKPIVLRIRIPKALRLPAPQTTPRSALKAVHIPEGLVPEPTNKPSIEMRLYRAKAYKAGLVALPIGEPFDASLNLGNVFASPAIESGESSDAALYVFVHDLPRGSEIVMLKYMSKILRSGSGLVDVAVPTQPTAGAERSRALRTITTQLLYAWDTYVARAGRRVVLLGSGLGSFAMKSLMESRQEDMKRVVACAISLHGDIKALPSVGSEFVNWYHENTSVLVPELHPAITNRKECRGNVMAARKYL